MRPAPRVRLVPAAILLALASGCGAFDDFDVTLTDQATIPGNWILGVPNTLPYSSFGAVDLKASKEFANMGVSPGDIDAIFVKSVTIEGTEPQKDNLGVILESVTFFVEAPGVERRQLATGMGFPQSYKADLTPDTMLNLKPYAEAASMKLDGQVKIKKQPLFDTTVKTTVVLHVDINLLGT